MLKNKIPTYVNSYITAAQSKQELTGTLAVILTKMKSQPDSHAISLAVRLAALEEEGKCGMPQFYALSAARHSTFSPPTTKHHKAPRFQ